MVKNFIFREANVSDIPGMQVVRNAVKENVLSDPKIITDLSYLDYLTDKGKGWVAVNDLRIIGFSFVDFKNHSIWALFVHPEFESMGIGTTLQKLMLDWYFLNVRILFGLEQHQKHERRSSTFNLDGSQMGMLIKAK